MFQKEYPIHTSEQEPAYYAFFCPLCYDAMLMNSPKMLKIMLTIRVNSGQ